MKRRTLIVAVASACAAFAAWAPPLKTGKAVGIEAM